MKNFTRARTLHGTQRGRAHADARRIHRAITGTDVDVTVYVMEEHDAEGLWLRTVGGGYTLRIPVWRCGTVLRRNAGRVCGHEHVSMQRPEHIYCTHAPALKTTPMSETVIDATPLSSSAVRSA